MKKILVYTVITGGFDQLCSIKYPEKNVDYYCFSDNKELTSFEWKIKYIENKENVNSRLLSKQYKLMGDSELEKKYDIVVYIDGNIQLECPITKIINKFCDFNKNSIFFLPHTERNCTYQEKEEIIRLNLDNPRVVKNQLKIYEQEGFPKNYGLVCSGFIARNAKDKKVKEMLKFWYKQVEKYSKRDQLSIMYSLWKNKLSIGWINLNYYNNSYFSVEMHQKARKQPILCAFGSGLTNLLGEKEEENKYEPEKENYHCNIEDKNDSHSSIARRVKPHSTVLDVGCGVGVIGRLLKENRDCECYGIEIDPVSFEKAKKSGYYQEVFSFSIEEKEKLKILEQKKLQFDYIILADVLEHTLEPWEVLNQLGNYLTPHGKVLISIPNVAYIDIIRALINRNFNYQKTGILDSTHFRFFTKSSFVEMIDNFNGRYDIKFDVEWFDSTIVKPEYEKEKLAELLDRDHRGMIVQEIFELTRLSKTETPDKLIKLLQEEPQDNFDAINQMLIAMEKENQELQQRIIEDNQQYELEKQNLQNRINEQAEEITKMQTEISNILTSKSWKVTKPLRDIKRVIKK